HHVHHRGDVEEVDLRVDLVLHDRLAELALVRREARRLGRRLGAGLRHFGTPKVMSGKRTCPSSALRMASHVPMIDWYGMLAFAVIVAVVSSGASGTWFFRRFAHAFSAVQS